MIKQGGGKAARDKGHSFEREIANIFRLLGYKNARRLLEYQEGKGIDLEGTGRFKVQCKVGVRTDIKLAFRQAKRACTINDIALAICKDNYSDTTVTMSLKDFVKVIRFFPL